MSKPRIDKSSPAYKKELYVCTTIVVVLTLLGSSILGWRISEREQRIAAMYKKNKEMRENPEKFKGRHLDANQDRYKFPVVR